MAEKFGDAALRHLETGDLLSDQGRRDDAAYHYGLVGEVALKEAVVRALGSLPSALRRHINHPGASLQSRITTHASIIGLLNSGRLGGGLGTELISGLLSLRFAGWAIDIRYADDQLCPVKQTDLALWQQDAVALYNNGVF